MPQKLMIFAKTGKTGIENLPGQRGKKVHKVESKSN